MWIYLSFTSTPGALFTFLVYWRLTQGEWWSGPGWNPDSGLCQSAQSFKARHTKHSPSPNQRSKAARTPICCSPTSGPGCSPPSPPPPPTSPPPPPSPPTSPPGRWWSLWRGTLRQERAPSLSFFRRSITSPFSPSQSVGGPMWGGRTSFVICM